MKTPLRSLVCRFVILLLFCFGLNLVHAQTPAFWGMTAEGGAFNAGTIFKMAPDGTGHVVQHSFTIENPGARPGFGSQMLQLANGKMYGVTEGGGFNENGVLYEYNPTTNAYTKLHDFAQATGRNPTGGFALAPNGKLYGLTSGGGSANLGVLFEFDLTSNTYTKKVDFTGTNGSLPFACTLYLHTNGKFYGVTNQGGTAGFGVLFEYDPATSIYTKKIDFTGTANGSFPYTTLMMTSTGRVFGATLQGGTNNNGTIYEYNPTNNTLTKRRDFATADGRFPLATLVEADNGRLYGLAGAGGANSQGTLFEFDLATNTFTKKIDFNGTNGAVPYPGFVKAANGKLYGLTNGGGTSGLGTIFEYDVTTNTLTKKLEFSSDPATGKSQGRVPTTNFTLSSNGLLYGTTNQGGLAGAGVIFEYNTSTDTYTKKIDFFYSPNGSYSFGGLVRAANGKFYGMTQIGGVNDEGVLFEFNPNGNVYTKRYDFNSTSGNYPTGSLAVAPNGKLYGMTNNEGSFDEGTLFEFDPTTNTFTKKVDFDSNTNGGEPQGSLVLASNNKFYGMTGSGGTNGDGVIFEYDPTTNSLIKKIDFEYNTGSEPYADLIQATNGKLYGMTREGGDNGNASGTLFEYDIATNTKTTRVNFSALNGENPEGNLVQAPNGKLYGMTRYGGANFDGVLFEFDPATNTYTKKLDFGGTTFGSQPSGSLAVSPNGKLYGGTNYGGANGRGVIFEYDPANNTFTKKLDFNSTNGAHILWQRFLFVKGEQIIAFATPSDKTIGDAAFNLTATSSAGLTVSFTTTSTKISISGNQVTLLSAGRATITAIQAGDASYNVAPSVDRSFCIKPAKPTITVNNSNTDSPTLTSSATTGNQWFRNGAAIAGATSATYSVTQPGIYKVQVSVEDCVSEFSNDQPMIVTGDIDRTDPAMAVYPNPVSDVLTVSLGDLHGKKEVSIIDLNGRKIESKEEAGTEARFNVSSYYTGTYLVKVKSQNTVTTIRFIKK